MISVVRYGKALIKCNSFNITTASQNTSWAIAEKICEQVQHTLKTITTTNVSVGSRGNNAAARIIKKGDLFKGPFEKKTALANQIN